MEAETGEGEGDNEPFLRLLSRAERSDSGVASREVWGMDGLGLAQHVMGMIGRRGVTLRVLD